MIQRTQPTSARMSHGHEEETRLTLVCFFLAGASSGFPYPLMMTAAEDILSGMVIPTSVVLISISLPGCLMALTSPLFFERIGIVLKVCAAMFFLISGLLIVTLSQRTWKLVGAVLISVSDSLGDMTFFSISSFYQDSTVGAYCAGAGLSAVLSVLYYLALTVVLDISPRVAVLGVSWVPLLMVVSCLKLRKGKTCLLMTNDKDYKPVPLTEKDDKPVTNTQLSSMEKRLAIWEIMPHFIALVIGLFSAFLSAQGIISTLVYKEAGLASREVFVVYNSAFTVASCVGRSYSFVISLINPSVQTYTKHTWALATASVTLMLFLLIESWYRFLNSLVLVCLLLALLGLIFGVLYVNVFALVGVSQDANKSVITRPFTVTAYNAGILMASLMALYVEPIIQRHCLYLTGGKPELCLARSTKNVL